MTKWFVMNNDMVILKQTWTREQAEEFVKNSKIRPLVIATVTNFTLYKEFKTTGE